jgi:flagellar biosynthetic protein FliR
MGTLFVVDIMLGFLARAVPQMNIFIIGLPLKIFIGFVLLFLSFNSLSYFITEIFNNGFKDMLRIIRFLGSG